MGIEIHSAKEAADTIQQCLVEGGDVKKTMHEVNKYINHKPDDKQSVEEAHKIEALLIKRGLLPDLEVAFVISNMKSLDHNKESKRGGNHWVDKEDIQMAKADDQEADSHLMEGIILDDLIKHYDEMTEARRVGTNGQVPADSDDNGTASQLVKDRPMDYVPVGITAQSVRQYAFREHAHDSATEALKPAVAELLQKYGTEAAFKALFGSASLVTHESIEHARNVSKARLGAEELKPGLTELLQRYGTDERFKKLFEPNGEVTHESIKAAQKNREAVLKREKDRADDIAPDAGTKAFIEQTERLLKTLALMDKQLDLIHKQDPTKVVKLDDLKQMVADKATPGETNTLLETLDKLDRRLEAIHKQDPTKVVTLKDLQDLVKEQPNENPEISKKQKALAAEKEAAEAAKAPKPAEKEAADPVKPPKPAEKEAADPVKPPKPADKGAPPKETDKPDPVSERQSAARHAADAILCEDPERLAKVVKDYCDKVKGDEQSFKAFGKALAENEELQKLGITVKAGDFSIAIHRNGSPDAILVTTWQEGGKTMVRERAYDWVTRKVIAGESEEATRNKVGAIMHANMTDAPDKANTPRLLNAEELGREYRQSSTRDFFHPQFVADVQAAFAHAFKMGKMDAVRALYVEIAAATNTNWTPHVVRENGKLQLVDAALLSSSGSEAARKMTPAELFSRSIMKDECTGDYVVVKKQGLLKQYAPGPIELGFDVPAKKAGTDDAGKEQQTKDKTTLPPTGKPAESPPIEKQKVPPVSNTPARDQHEQPERSKHGPNKHGHKRMSPVERAEMEVKVRAEMEKQFAAKHEALAAAIRDLEARLKESPKANTAAGNDSQKQSKPSVRMITASNGKQYPFQEGAAGFTLDPKTQQPIWYYNTRH